MVYYKYRGFSNLEFALDIFINQRLYASVFRDLNDPMEGTFTYSKGLLNQNQLDNILSKKSQLKILSLSRTSNNMLMWSYYAEAHKGFVVGVEINDKLAEIKSIEYVNDLTLNYKEDDNNRAKSILSKKLKLWTHEEEERVFIPGYKTFIDVKIKKLIFGSKCDKGQKELLTKIAEAFCPGIDIDTIARDKLDYGAMKL